MWHYRFPSRTFEHVWTFIHLIIWRSADHPTNEQTLIWRATASFQQHWKTIGSTYPHVIRGGHTKSGESIWGTNYCRNEYSSTTVWIGMCEGQWNKYRSHWLVLITWLKWSCVKVWVTPQALEPGSECNLCNPIVITATIVCQEPPFLWQPVVSNISLKGLSVKHPFFIFHVSCNLQDCEDPTAGSDFMVRKQRHSCVWVASSIEAHYESNLIDSMSWWCRFPKFHAVGLQINNLSRNGMSTWPISNLHRSQWDWNRVTIGKFSVPIIVELQGRATS